MAFSRAAQVGFPSFAGSCRYNIPSSISAELSFCNDILLESCPLEFHLQGDLAILLPITIDGEQKELAIYENDDPTDAVLAFCAKNMPDEVADCVDDVLASVQDTLTVTTEDVKVIAE